MITACARARDELMADVGETGMHVSEQFNGYFDRYEAGRASGWVANVVSPRTIVPLVAVIDGQEVGHVLCEKPRPDVRDALGLPSEQVGFTYDIPERFLDGQPHVLSFLLPDGGLLPHMGAGGLSSLGPSLAFSDVPLVTLRGRLDGLVHNALRGWVLRERNPGGRCETGCDLLVTCDDVRVGQARADRLRRDVASVLDCDPNCGFEFPIPLDFRRDYPQRFRVFALPDMIELEGSPVVSSSISDRLEGRLLSLAADMSRLHGEMARMRREIELLLPSQGYSLEDYDRWARRYYDALRARVALGRSAAQGRGAPEPLVPEPLVPEPLVSEPLVPEPLVSVLLPAYRPMLRDFNAAVDSVLAQTYANWELVIVDDGSRSEELTQRIEFYARQDKRIRSIKRAKNVGIARATSLAMEAARGAWVAFFDHDDLLVDVALEVMVRAAQRTGARLLYSDEDKIDQAGHYREPNFKPDWNYRYLLGCNYVCHLTMVEAALMREVGPLRRECDGAQDHDFILRCAEKLGAGQIHHVPELLYHRRITPGSTAADISNKQYAVDAGVRAVSDHLERTGRAARVAAIGGLTIYDVEYLSQAEPRVAIIIPFRDQLETTRACVRSLVENTQYRNFEIVLVDNWSTGREAPAFREEMRAQRRVGLLEVAEEFNYSRLNNIAAAQAHEADFFLFLNNDVIATDPDWLRRLVAEAMAAEDVAVVGAKLLYPDRTVQHAGVLVGVHGVAAHPHLGLGFDEYGYIGRARLAQEVSAVTAACMLVRAGVFRALGGFDEAHLAVAYNDIDLCLRAREAGYRIVWAASIVAEHHESLSRGSDQRPDQEARFFREQQVMLERWGEKPFFRDDPFYNPNFSKTATLFHHLVGPSDRPPV